MATIYDHEDCYTITDGLQGCDVCDEAIQIAERIADERGKDVLLSDDDGYWVVHPAESDGSRRPADDGTDYAP